MPYYINKATSSLYVNIPTWSCGSAEDFVIEIDYRGNTSGFNRPLGKNTGFVSRILIRHDSSPGFFLTNDAGTSASWPLPNGYTDIVNGGNFYKMRFVRTAGSVEFFYDGVSQGTRALSGIFSIERVFIQGGTHDLTNNAIKTLELTKATDSRLYRGETGTGIEWPDSVSGQTGFVQNPTGTDAEWVLYSESSGVSSSASFALPQISVSANQVSVFGSSVSMALPQLSVSVAQSSTPPSYTSVASFAMPQIGVSVAQEYTAPTSGSTVNFTLPQMQVSANQSYVAPVYDASVSAALPQMQMSVNQLSVFSASVTTTLPQMVVSAVQASTQPGNGSSIAFTLPQMSMSVAQASATPSYSSGVIFSLPQMTVLIASGDIVYYSGAGTHVDIITGSTHIDLLTGSTHVDVSSGSTHVDVY